MINKEKWVSSLPIKKINPNNVENQLDHNKWTNTIAKKNSTFNSVQKYSLMATIFVCGLLFVAVIKNETRNLQKKINNLETNINLIEFNLDQAILDSEVITSPENISLLAKEYLNIDLEVYTPSQIIELNKKQKEKNNNLAKKDLKNNIKEKFSNKIAEKKNDIRKLKTLYSNPKTIPAEIRIEVANKIKKKKNELTNLYKSPETVFTLEKAGKWSVVQIVKLFLGIPIVPGR